MGPPKWPQTIYFKRFGTFAHVLMFLGNGGTAGRRPAARTYGRTFGRTYVETGARAQTTPATHAGKKYDVRRPPPHSDQIIDSELL